MIVVDGGFIAWLFGSDQFGQFNWRIDGRKKYSRNSGAIILLDSRHSDRRDFYPDYKSKRATKREEKPERQEKYEMVHTFIDEILEKDPNLATVKVRGKEADDLVAVIIQQRMVPLPVKILGVDKDLLQFPRGDCIIERTNGQRATIKHFEERLPVALHGYVMHPLHVLLSLCLMGDKSDSIPRLIPPRRLDIMQEILKSDRPVHKAADLFKEPFLVNLSLAVLPSPWCFDPVPNPEEVMKYVSAGLWWNMAVKPELASTIRTVIETLPPEEEDDDEF